MADIWADLWNRVKARAATFGGAYVMLLGGVLGAAVASVTHNRWLLAGGFAVLALAASRFHEVVGDAGDAGRLRRVLLAVGQLVIGGGLAALAWYDSIWAADTMFLVGAALAILAAGSLIAELRTVKGPLPLPWRIVVGAVAAAVLLAAVLLGVGFPAAAVLVALAAIVVCDLRNRAEGRWFGRRGMVLLLASVALLAIAATPVPDALFVALVVAGVVAGEVGTELLSEDSHDWKGPWRRLLLPVGVVLLLAVVALLVSADVRLSHALLLVGGLAVIAWMAASAGDSLLLVGLVVLALLWTATPQGPRRPGDGSQVHDVDRGDQYFLVLGDSYISGEGATRFLPGTNTTDVDEDDHINECRRAPTAWPLRLARYNTQELGDLIPARALFLACSGATTENIDTEPRLDEQGDQAGPAELELFEQAMDAGLRQPEFVVVQVGGNDAHFGDIGQACVGPGSCAELGEQFLDGLNQIQIDGQLDAAYQRIKDHVDDGVPIIAVPYPIPLSATNVCDDVLLSGDEHHFVAGFVEQLNQVVRSAARRNGLLYMDTMEGALRERGTMLCDEQGLGAGINFLAFNPKEGALGERLNPGNWTHNSLHPNAAGHEALHDAAVEWFEAHTDLRIPQPRPSHRHDVAEVDSFFEDGRHIRQCAPADSRSCTTKHYAWHLRQVRDVYWGVVPLALVMIGAWLVLMRPMWGARKRGITLAKVVRATLRPEPPPA